MGMIKKLVNTPIIFGPILTYIGATFIYLNPIWPFYVEKAERFLFLLFMMPVTVIAIALKSITGGYHDIE